MDATTIRLIRAFENGYVKYHSFIDLKQKTIYVKLTDKANGRMPLLAVTLLENSIKFVMGAYILENTYNTYLATVFIDWFKPILRDIVKNKYELAGEVISDELEGTDYCQVREDGLLLFNNLTEMLEFTNQT